MSAHLDPSLLQRAAQVRLLLSDIDGCWTDGGIHVSTEFGEIVRFHVHDGYGVKMLHDAGVEIAIISGREVPAVEQRARYLGVKEIYLGHIDKARFAAELCRTRGLLPEQVAAFGDDLPDLALFDQAGLRFAPANAVAGVRAAADYVCERAGGSGAFREVAELLLAGRSESGGR